MSISGPPPVPGDWYSLPDGEQFEIVAVDEDAGTIEIQHFDGAVEELDTEMWQDLTPEPIAPPEDWTGSMDVPAEDATPASETSLHEEDLTEFLDRMDR